MGWKEQSDNRQVLYDSNDNLVLEVGDDSSLYNRAGTQILSGNGGSLPVNAETYGAVGDSVTDDTVALEAMIASGKNIRLLQNKTYLHRRQLNMTAAGQIIDGNGSTFKRVAQVVTTTATTLVSGVTTVITVASAANLRVGDRIVAEQGGVYDAVGPIILSIVGNVVTTTTAHAVSFSGTTNIRTGWSQITVGAADCRITNLVMDGNVANWSWGRWNQMVTIFGYGTAPRLYVDRCRIINQYGDGFSPAAAGWSFAYNDVENLKGRGVVFSGNTGQPSDLDTRVVYNRFINNNGDSAVGASDGTGTINFSQGGPATLIHGNYIDGGINGIGSLRSYTNSDCTITDNEFWNLTGLAIEGAASGATQNADHVIIANNRCYGAGGGISLNNVGSAAFGSRWKIMNNLVIGAGIRLANCTEVTVQGNTVSGEALGTHSGMTATAVVGGGTFAAGTYYYKVTAYNAAGETLPSTEVSATVALNGSILLNWYIVPGATGYKLYRTTVAGNESVSPALVTTITSATTSNYLDTGTATSAGNVPATDTTLLTTLSLIWTGGSSGAVDQAIISGNQLLGGQYGIKVDQSTTNVLFDGNFLIGQYTIGVFLSTATGVSGIDVSNNTIIGTAASASGTYECINVVGGPIIRGNRCDWTNVVAGTGAIVCSGTAVDAVIENNIIRGGAHTTCLAMQSGATRTVVRFNQLDHKPSDSGTNTHFSGNKYTTGIASGRAVLVAGTVTVSTTEVLTADNIQLTNVLLGGTAGFLTVGAIVNATSFVITSSNAADTSTVYWKIDH